MGAESLRRCDGITAEGDCKSAPAEAAADAGRDGLAAELGFWAGLLGWTAGLGCWEANWAGLLEGGLERSGRGCRRL